MGHVSRKKIILLICCFLLAGFAANRQKPTVAAPKKMPLAKALSVIKGWQALGNVPLDDKIIKILDLDDYINQDYSNGNRIVSLYIGYYRTLKKVGAAHDPLVCFPGQGWTVLDRSEGQLVINSGQRVNYSSMLVQRNEQKQIVVYWFQSYDQATPDTFSQKISLFKGKIFQKGEDNAFVRLSVGLGERSLPEAKKDILAFAKRFYPVFVSYIKND